MKPTIFFGCDYYPEQWADWLDEGEARWETDARLMAEAGFNTVRLGEFSWGLVEPEPDHFDFAWLDRAITILQQHGMHIVLGTPTLVPPPWLLTAYPDMTLVDSDGRRMGPGTRREACANHPIYQERSQIIVAQMAARYANHPAVIGWQTDNEFGCHDTGRCYCDHCAHAFRRWLEARYVDLDVLSKAWGGVFWGEVYRTWEQIPLPTRSAAERNPGHALDFYRFSSDSWARYHRAQIAILRDLCPDHFVTHNLMGFFPQLDYYDLCQGLDFVSWDSYHYHGATPAAIAAAHDHMRGILQRNFWVMEQQIGQVNWSAYNPATPPNFVRLKTYQAIAHGADGMMYFRWRQALAGSEQYHSGLLDHAGRQTQAYVEASQIGVELKRLAPHLADTRPQADCAILLDYDSRWSLQQQPHNQLLNYDVAQDYHIDLPALLMDGPDADHGRPMTGRAYLAWPYLAPYIALWQKAITVDILSPEADLSGYKLVCTPFLKVLRPKVFANLKHYVESGGILILGPRTGDRDEHNRLFTEPQPGPLAELTGSTVRFFDSLEPERSNTLHWADAHAPNETVINLWAEILESDGAEMLASYTQDWYAGATAITLKRHDKGQVIYVGCMGGPALYHTLFDQVLPRPGMPPLTNTQPGIEICARYRADGSRLLFVLNHSASVHILPLTPPVVDLLTNTEYHDLLHIAPGQIIIFNAEDKNSIG